MRAGTSWLKRRRGRAESCGSSRASARLIKPGPAESLGNPAPAFCEQLVLSAGFPGSLQSRGGTNRGAGRQEDS